MTDSQKRDYVRNLYDGPKWKKRVDKMSDQQIGGIFRDHQLTGFSPPLTMEEIHEQSVLYEVPQDPHHNEDDFPIY